MFYAPVNAFEQKNEKKFCRVFPAAESVKKPSAGSFRPFVIRRTSKTKGMAGNPRHAFTPLFRDFGSVISSIPPSR
jgi:hypothetical protein